MNAGRRSSWPDGAGGEKNGHAGARVESIAPSFCQRLACILDTPRSGRNVMLDISSEVGRGAGGSLLLPSAKQ
jgi:hypothetical protein